MSETAILNHVAALTVLREQGVRAETTASARRMLADQLGVRVPVNQVPMHERSAWTLPDAAKVYGIDRHVLQKAANMGLLATFRPLTARGTLGWRHVRREEMERWISQFEE